MYLLNITFHNPSTIVNISNISSCVDGNSLVFRNNNWYSYEDNCLSSQTHKLPDEMVPAKLLTSVTANSNINTILNCNITKGIRPVERHSKTVVIYDVEYSDDNCMNFQNATIYDSPPCDGSAVQFKKMNGHTYVLKNSNKKACRASTIDNLEIDLIEDGVCINRRRTFVDKAPARLMRSLKELEMQVILNNSGSDDLHSICSDPVLHEEDNESSFEIRDFTMYLGFLCLIVGIFGTCQNKWGELQDEAEKMKEMKKAYDAAKATAEANGKDNSDIIDDLSELDGLLAETEKRPITSMGYKNTSSSGLNKMGGSFGNNFDFGFESPNDLGGMQKNTEPDIFDTFQSTQPREPRKRVGFDRPMTSQAFGLDSGDDTPDRGYSQPRVNSRPNTTPLMPWEDNSQKRNNNNQQQPPVNNLQTQNSQSTLTANNNNSNNFNNNNINNNATTMKSPDRHSSASPLPWERNYSNNVNTNNNVNNSNTLGHQNSTSNLRVPVSTSNNISSSAASLPQAKYGGNVISNANPLAEGGNQPHTLSHKSILHNNNNNNSNNHGLVADTSPYAPTHFTPHSKSNATASNEKHQDGDYGLATLVIRELEHQLAESRMETARWKEEVECVRRQLSTDRDTAEDNARRRLANARSEHENERDRQSTTIRRLEEEVSRLRQIHSEELKSTSDQKSALIAEIEVEKESAREEERRRARALAEEDRIKHKSELEDVKRQASRIFDDERRALQEQISGLRRQLAAKGDLQAVVDRLSSSAARVEDLSTQLHQNFDSNGVSGSLGSRLAQDESSLRELELALRMQQQETAIAQKRLSEMLEKLSSQQTEHEVSRQAEVARLSAEHQRLLDLQSNLKVAEKSGRDSLQQSQQVLEEEKRAFQRSMREQNQQVEDKILDISRRERLIRDEESRLKDFRHQIDIARSQVTQKIKETENLVANERGSLSREIEILEERKKILSDEKLELSAERAEVDEIRRNAQILEHQAQSIAQKAFAKSEQVKKLWHEIRSTHGAMVEMHQAYLANQQEKEEEDNRVTQERLAIERQKNSQLIQFNGNGATINNNTGFLHNGNGEWQQEFNEIQSSHNVIKSQQQLLQQHKSNNNSINQQLLLLQPTPVQHFASAAVFNNPSLSPPDQHLNQNSHAPLSMVSGALITPPSTYLATPNSISRVNGLAVTASSMSHAATSTASNHVRRWMDQSRKSTAFSDKLISGHQQFVNNLNANPNGGIITNARYVPSSMPHHPRSLLMMNNQQQDQQQILMTMTANNPVNGSNAASNNSNQNTNSLTRTVNGVSFTSIPIINKMSNNNSGVGGHSSTQTGGIRNSHLNGDGEALTGSGAHFTYASGELGTDSYLLGGAAAEIENSNIQSLKSLVPLAEH